MRTLIALSLAMAFCSTASAEVIDLSAATCKQFRNSTAEDARVILNWLDGYYKRENDLPVIDTVRFSSNAQALDEYCAAHPGTALFTATANLFQK